jgi:hypothetical protein
LCRPQGASPFFQKSGFFFSRFHEVPNFERMICGELGSDFGRRMIKVQARPYDLAPKAKGFSI